MEKLPPPEDTGELIIVGNREIMKWRKLPHPEPESGFEHAFPGSLSITVGPFFQSQYGVCGAYLKEPNGAISTSGWLLGYDPVSEEPPAFVLKESLNRSLLLAKQYLTERDICPSFVSIRASNWRTVIAVRRWFNEGNLELVSAAATSIASTLGALTKILKCPLIMRGIPPYFFEDVEVRGTRDCDVIYHTISRMYQYIIPDGLTSWRRCLARLPWTKDEVKTHLKRRLRLDELKFIALLEQLDSVSSSICRHLSLNRDTIKQVLKSFRYQRDYQTTFCNIVCATRFKSHDENGSLLPTLCPLCRVSPDSLGHLLSCTNLEITPRSGDDQIEFLRTLVMRSCKGNPGFPQPIRLVEPPEETESEGEISLAVSSS